MTNLAPEPGQRVYVEAEVLEVLDEARILLRVPDPRFENSTTARLWADVVVWHPADVPPQPPVLDNDALREQVAAMLGMDVDEGWMTIAVELLDWATRPAAPLADERSPDDSTPTPEPDEAQTGAQGAGRDWRDEVYAITEDVMRAPEPPNEEGFWISDLAPDLLADRLVAALGLHDLEQAAAGQSVIARETVRRLRAEIEYRKATEAQLTAERDNAIDAKRSALDDYAAVAKAHREDANAARRELEQLRGEVERVARDLDRLPYHVAERAVRELRTALEAS